MTDSPVPSFSELYQLLAENGVRSAEDWKLRRWLPNSWSAAKNYGGDGRGFELKMKVCQFFERYSRYVASQASNPQCMQTRLVSTSLAREHLNLLATLSDEGVILVDSVLDHSIDSSSHHLDDNCPYIPPELISALFTARPLLDSGRAVVVPSQIVRKVHYHYMSESRETIFDFHSSLQYPHAQFVGSNTTSVAHPAFPTLSTRKSTPSNGSGVSWIPVCRMRMPLLRRCETGKLIAILNEETDAAWRLKFTLHELLLLDAAGLTSDGLAHAFDKIEFEVRKLEGEYKSLLRKRENSLSQVFVGSVGLLLCLALPADLAKYAKDVLGIFSAAKSLEYVTSVRDTNQVLKQNDAYVMWKALKNSGWKAEE